MQRCPACNARLGATSLCGRCGADPGRIMRCEQLAATWLSVSLQTLHAGKMDLAAAAIQRSLSLQQTPAARLVKAFLIRQYYRALYDNLDLQRYQQAQIIVKRLRELQGENEALQRFADMADYLSALHSQNANPSGDTVPN